MHETGSSPRRYTLLSNYKRWLSVSAIIRNGLAFAGGERAPRSGVHVFSNDSTELVRACL